jgi:hypothetical protein
MASRSAVPLKRDGSFLEEPDAANVYRNSAGRVPETMQRCGLRGESSFNADYDQ